MGLTMLSRAPQMPIRPLLLAVRACSSWITLLRLNDLIRILNRLDKGDRTAAEELLPLVYNELRQMASRKMAGEPHGHTLQPTALVHEAWVRLGADAQPRWQSRVHSCSCRAASFGP